MGNGFARNHDKRVCAAYMRAKEITDKKIWDAFIISQPFYTFMNSWDWGEFNRIMGSKIFRLGFYENENLIAVTLIIKIEARRGAHFFCPYGPALAYSENYFKVLGIISEELKKLAKLEKVCFLRVNPLIESSYENLEKFKKMGFKFAPMHVHAEDNWLLDLCYGKSAAVNGRDAINRVYTTGDKPLKDDEMLGNMRKTTRYMIKRAEKEGVKVEKNNTEKYILKFIEMHHNHSQRGRGNKYTPFSKIYVENLFKVFSKDDINLMYAEYEGNIEAMLVSIKYGKTTAYYLGASDIRHPKFSPAYLLQWEAIKKARNAGCETYNFWGVSPDDNPSHPLAGVSLFKKGFGGYGYKLLHVHDMPLSGKYWVNWGVESVRRVRRGYYYKF